MIRNKRTGEVLARGEIHCRRFWELATGLRFRRGKAAVLHFGEYKRVTLDMWFVFYPISVLFLDEDLRVVEIKKNLRPWQSYTSQNNCCHAVEIEDYRRCNARIGDKLVFT